MRRGESSWQDHEEQMIVTAKAAHASKPNFTKMNHRLKFTIKK